MIFYIEGVIKDIFDGFAIVFIDGIGYRLYLKKDTLHSLSKNESRAFFVYQYIKEDKNELYGFETLEEREFFELLVSVSGVGPKSALAILSLDNLEKIKQAISNSDELYLSQVSGIGKKTAKKMILELQDKLGAKSDTYAKTEPELIDALLSLGYKRKELSAVLDKIDHDKPLEEKVKQALALLSKI